MKDRHRYPITCYYNAWDLLHCTCDKLAPLHLTNTPVLPTERIAHTSATAGDRCAHTSSQRIGPRSMPRPVEFRNRVEVVDPCLLRANKYLPARHQFISLAQRSKPHIVGFWLIINRGCIERRPALGAKTLQTDVSAIGGLSIFCRLAGQEHERAWTSDNNRSQWSAAHCLAVCAVANGRRFGIGFGLERHVSAVTASINFHDRFLEFRK
jgi:hypothetical protein